MLGLCLIYSVLLFVIKAFGEHTNIDDPLDEKFWRKRNKDWFMQRIGKRIYRNDTGCSCATCKDTTENGLIIIDEFHVYYLLMIQDEIEIEYRDIK